jgi:hypothetical protein
MSFDLVPLVDDQTFLFPPQTMTALGTVLGGDVGPDEIAAAVDQYFEDNPPTGDEPLLAAHIVSATPHPAYDVDMQDLTTLFENGMA